MCEFPFVETSLLVAFFPVSANPCPTPVSILLLLAPSLRLLLISTWGVLIGWLYTGREYAAADSRWGTADPTVVSLELLTVLAAGPLAAFIVYQIVKRDPARHYWIIVLNTAELYGGYVFRFLAGGSEQRVGGW